MRFIGAGLIAPSDGLDRINCITADACAQMTRLYLNEWRNIPRAFRCCVRAPRSKHASRRRRDRAWQLACQNDPCAFCLRIGNRHG